MSEYILSDEELRQLNAEAERMNQWRNSLETLAYLKFFRSEQYLDDLIAGKFFCNTPKYYRLNYEPGVGDGQEAVSYSGGNDHLTGVDLSASIGPVSVGAMLQATGLNPDNIKTLEIAKNVEGYEHGWLHCWFAIDKVGDASQLAQLLTNLKRVREEFGCNYASLNADGYTKLLRRFEERGIAPVRTARVSYSDSAFHNGIECKRLQYQYQQEFRFIFGQCDANEINPRIIELGDLSDILQVNSEFAFADYNETVHFRLTKDELYANPKTFSKVAT